MDSISCDCPLWHIYCDTTTYYPFCRKFRSHIKNLSTPLTGRGIHQERWDMSRADKLMLTGMYIAATADVAVAIGVFLILLL